MGALHMIFYYATNDKACCNANGIGGVKTPPYGTIGKGDIGGDASIARKQVPPKRADDEHRPLQYGRRGISAPKGSIWRRSQKR